MKLPDNFNITLKDNDHIKINDIKYYYHEHCVVCDDPFLSRRKEAVTCTRECCFSGERNPRHNDHRTWEELIGKERADKNKDDYRQNWINNNPNSNGNHWINKLNKNDKQLWRQGQGKVQALRGKKFYEFYGVERANEIRYSISVGTKKNMPEMGPPPISSGYGYSGKYKGYHFRSLLELSYIKHLIDNNINFKSAENKEFAVKYINSKGNTRKYYPDFYLIDENKIIEIKPKFKARYDSDVMLKCDAAKLVYGDKYVMLNEDDIRNMTNLITANDISNIKDIIIYNKGRKAT